MEYVLGIALVVVCGLACVLFYYDMSPKTALYKIANQYFGVPERSRPIVRDAPYRRLWPVSNGLHRPVLLNLETSEGSGQSCHPDIAHIPGGFGLKKWPYWMVCTPYPYQGSRFENPEIFASYDGLTWSIPDGVRNPLVPSHPGAGDHNSDPDLLFHDNGLWLFFRETIRSSSPTENSIYLMKSGDGTRWTAPAKILGEKLGTELLSPAVIHDANSFVMWIVELHGGELKLMRRSSLDALSWSAPAPCSVIGLDEGRFPWHIDVIQEEDRLSAVLVSCEQLGGSRSRIHYAYSKDHGLT
jgi:hypothetical protein